MRTPYQPFSFLLATGGANCPGSYLTGGLCFLLVRRRPEATDEELGSASGSPSAVPPSAGTLEATPEVRLIYHDSLTGIG